MAKKNSLTASSSVSAPPVVAQLVEKFAEHRETYRRAGYNETQLLYGLSEEEIRLVQGRRLAGELVEPR